MAKYIPPHLRNQKQKNIIPATLPSPVLSVTEILNLECHPRCKDWMGPTEQICCHHKYLKYPSTGRIAAKFDSKIFHAWLAAKKQPGEGNPGINASFYRKSDRDTKPGQRYDSMEDATKSLFNRFLRYAVDINLELQFVEKAVEDDFRFLDLGFAPGGMAQLLLNRNKKCRGVGVNLDPELGGNVYPSFLDNVRDNNINRFVCIQEDVIELAKSSRDLRKISGFEDGFDLVIIGITTSGSYQKQESEMDELELKNLLHFSQLLLACRFLKKGGRVLMRLHLSLRLVDIHILTILIENFTTQTVTKPQTEFAMRKTFWAYAEGFSPNEGLVKRLESLIKVSAPYAESGATIDNEPQLNMPILVEDPIDNILDIHGDKIRELLEPMWLKQLQTLEAVMNGLTDRVCQHCRSGRICKRCQKNVPRHILNAVMSVSKYLNQLDTNLLL